MSDRINWSVFLTRRFWELLGGVLWSGLKVALPLTLAFLIPPWASPIYWLLALASERVEFSRRSTITVTDMWMFAANLSIAAAVARVLPNAWFRLLGAIAALIAAFALSEWLRVVFAMPRPQKKSAGDSNA